MRVAEISLAVAVVTAIVVPQTANSARELISDEAATASVPAHYDCGRIVPITVDAPKENYFEGDRRALQKLIGGIRATLSFECPSSDLKQINIQGRTDDTVVFQGRAGKTNEWRLEPAKEEDVDVASSDGEIQINPVRSWDTIFARNGFFLQADGEKLCDINPHLIIVASDRVVLENIQGARPSLSDSLIQFVKTINARYRNKCLSASENRGRYDLEIWGDEYPVYFEGPIWIRNDGQERGNDKNPLDERRHILSKAEALHFATKHGYYEASKSLLESGVSASARIPRAFGGPICKLGSISRGFSHEASSDLMRLLLDEGAAPPFNCDVEHGPLFVAANNGTADDVKLLLEHGADPNRSSYKGTVLEIAVKNNDNPEVVKTLMTAGAAATDKVVKLAEERFDDQEVITSLKDKSREKASDFVRRCEELASPPGQEGGIPLEEINSHRAIETCDKAARFDETNVVKSDGDEEFPEISYSEFYGDRARYARLEGIPAIDDLTDIQPLGCFFYNDQELTRARWAAAEAAFFYAHIWHAQGVTIPDENAEGEWMGNEPNKCFEWAVDTINELVSDEGLERAKRYKEENSVDPVPHGWVALAEVDISDLNPYPAGAGDWNSRPGEAARFAGCSADGPGAQGRLVFTAPDNLDFDTMPEEHYTGIQCKYQRRFDGSLRMIIPER